LTRWYARICQVFMDHLHFAQSFCLYPCLMNMVSPRRLNSNFFISFWKFQFINFSHLDGAILSQNWSTFLLLFIFRNFITLISFYQNINVLFLTFLILFSSHSSFVLTTFSMTLSLLLFVLIWFKCIIISFYSLHPTKKSPQIE
jgi:hypothetical protein